MPARGLCALAAIAVVAAETSQVEQLMREVAELKQEMASLTALLEVLARERATRSLTCCFEDEGSPEDAAPATTA